MRTVFNSKRGKRHQSRGATLVEAALTLPLFLVFIGVIIDLSLIAARRSIVFESLREAAIQGARQRAYCSRTAAATFMQKIDQSILVNRRHINRVEVQQFTQSMPVISARGLNADFRRLRLRVEAELPCFWFCSMTLADSGLSLRRTGGNFTAAYRVEVVFPLDTQEPCREECNDGIDNDLDAQADAVDIQCGAQLRCNENGASVDASVALCTDNPNDV